MENSESNAQKLTLPDLIPGGATFQKFCPSNLKTFWWGNELIQLKDNTFLLYKNGNWEPLFSALDIKDTLNSCESAKGLDIQEFVQYSFQRLNEPILQCFNDACFVLYNWTQKTIELFTKLPEKSKCLSHLSEQQLYAYIFENNLYVSSYDGQTKYKISQDGSRDIVYGQVVHREEFGIDRGTFWSPNGKYLCFYRMDQSMVTDYPLVNISTRIATTEPTKYPMAGETSHKVSVGIYDFNTQQTIYLDTGDNTDQYYCGITWNPNNNFIYLYNLNRQQNHLKLLEFDICTGKQTRQLYEETSSKYINIRRGLTFLPWDDNSFLFSSEKDGYDHLYLFNLQTTEITKITDDKFGVVLSIVGFNQSTKSVIINCTGELELQHNLYSISLENSSYQLLGNQKGSHNASLSSDGSLLVDSWSAYDVPLQIDLINTTNNEIVTLHQSPNPYEGYTLPEITTGKIESNDENKTKLHYRLIKPVDFDSAQKYPCVIYVYGGPHCRLVLNEWLYRTRGWEIYMAQRGYVVFVLDGRGSDERGYEFESVIYKQLGKYEMEDQMKGVEFLKSLSYVDADRIGVHGWSYGGFMTTNLMLTYPDAFKVAVAGGPVINWAYYEIMYGERYMSTPQENEEGYRRNNLCLRASNLKGRLMIIFGYNDDVCVPQHSLSFIRACETAMTYPDMLTYPGGAHNMFGQDRVHLYTVITRYFDDHLKNLKKQ
ncbi:Peptidase, S9A B C, catalytic domain protein [Tritrichomonas musculus]|uniref:Peptidase, S9A B C, catalytic domain protein n=1 Tax=Tritrichomonas musculus TaxID=1915356 RepID=A0ABR2JWN9_9EUKA